MPVNKEAAEMLKKAGYREKGNTYYQCRSDLDRGDKLHYSHNEDADWNHGPWYSAPSHLVAADWLWEKHKITIIFYPKFTIVKFTFPEMGEDFKETDPSHRDSALIEACKRISLNSQSQK